MKNNLNKMLLLLLTFTFSLLVCLNVSATSNDSENPGVNWCDSTTVKASKLKSVSDSFHEIYTILESSNADTKLQKLISKDKYSEDGLYRYLYSFEGSKSKYKGYYRLEYSDEQGHKTVYPDANGNFSFEVITEEGNQITLYSYPNTNLVQPYPDSFKKKENYSTCNPKKVLPGTDENYNSYISLYSFSTEFSDDSSDTADLTFGSVQEEESSDVIKNDGNENLFCQFDTSKNSKSYTFKTTEKVGKYFQVVCKETLSIKFDSPKASYSGGGFKYTVALKTTKQCKIKKIDYPKKKKICAPTFYFTDTHTTNGGPNDDFDACVESCDGGLYTNSCSNKCYKQVYEKKNVIANDIDFKDSSKSNIKQLIVSTSRGTGTQVKDENGNNKAWCYVKDNYHPPADRSYRKGQQGTWWWRVCPSAETLEKNPSAKPRKMKPNYVSNSSTNLNRPIRKSNGKLADDGKVESTDTVYGCVYGFQSKICKGTMKCSTCPKDTVETKARQTELYNKELNKYYSELQTALQKAGNDNATIDTAKNFNKFDEYLTAYEKITTEENMKNTTKSISRKVSYNSKELKEFKNGTLTYSDVNSSGWSYINFPYAYINLFNYSVEYKSTPSYSNNNEYVFGGHLFYSKLGTTADDTNDIRYYPYNADSFGITSGIIESKDVSNSKNNKYAKNKTINWNIVTLIEKFGSSNQWNIDVNCYYGASVSECGDDPNEKCSCTGDNCDDGGIAGLPYMYRTVNLEDLFPNRDPGYNWQDWSKNISNKKASTTGYMIEPKDLISSIQSKGSTIYNGKAYVSFNSSSIEQAKSDNGLYTNFNGTYTKSNGISFFNSDYASDVKTNTNRTN